VFVAASQATDTNVAAVITIPAESQVGDIAWLVQIIANTVTATTPSGWTVSNTTDIGNLRYTRYRRVLTAGQPGTGVTLTVSGITKQSAVMAVLRAVDNVAQENSESPAVTGDNVAAANRTNPSATLTDARDVLSFVFTRGNTPTTLWTPPAGWTYAAGAYTLGGGGTTAAVAYKSASAGAIGGDVWTSGVSELRGGTSMTVVVGTGTTSSGPALSVWNGAAVETVEALGVWNGTSVDAVEILGVWDGTSIQAIA
jgi:hypothetical protein